MSSLERAPFSGKGIAPFLDVANTERAAACARLANLFYEMRDAGKRLNATPHVLEPLLRLLPHEPAAAAPLVTMGWMLTNGSAYPEAARCIDAVVDLPLAERVGHFDVPWDRALGVPMTWPRERTLLRLKRAHCHLAMGEHAAGEELFAKAIAEAAVELPPRFQFNNSIYGCGTPEDYRLYALTLGARALRAQFEGRDASPDRKVKKRKPGVTGDPAQLAQARAYLDEALVRVAPRALEVFGGMEPQPVEAHPTYGQPHRDSFWHELTYFESALVHEHLGALDVARLHLGRARRIAALADPGLRWKPDLVAAIDRLGVVDTPLGP